MSEQFSIDLVCAVRDAPFSYTFEREAGEALYSLISVDMPDLETNPTATSASSAPKFEDLPVSEVDWGANHVDCPWCRFYERGVLDISFMKCGRCDRYVCGGRGKDKYWNCTEACGSHGPTGYTLSSLSGSQQHEQQALPISPAPSATPRLAPSLPPPEFRKETIALPSRKALVKTGFRLEKPS